MAESQIERIKAALTIEAAWAMLGLKGTPKRDCRSPFRDDKRPSFSVYKAGGWQRWHDHGEGAGGDVVDLWAKARGIDVKAAVEEILRLLPQLNIEDAPPPHKKAPAGAPKAQSGIRWPPDLRKPTEAEIRALAELRGLSAGAFDIAIDLGTLKVATLFGDPAWVILDASGICAEARRFDGAMYRLRGKEMKSYALPGSKKNWPVGLLTDRPEFNASGNVLLVEGAPDYFAALELALGSNINFRPCAMLGAGCHIGTEAQKHLDGCHVLIIPHNDPKGQEASIDWANQISASGAKKIVVQRLPEEAKDLNDLVRLDPVSSIQVLKGFNAIPGSL